MGAMLAKTAIAGGKAPIEAGHAARHAVEVASDRQASDIVLLDVREHTAFADYMVILSADSARQINALADALAEAVETSGLPMHHREGTADSGWVLLDFGDVVVHVFDHAQRDYYQLERVWKAAVPLIRVQ